MSLPVLRDYQERGLDEIRREFKSHQAVLYVAPCGSGKGTLCSYIVQSAASKGNRVIFLVDRRALVNDFSDRLTRLGLSHGVIMGNDSRRAPWLPVHVASIDTIVRRENAPHADILICDEARFSSSPKWKKVFDRYPNCKILGMDGTPARRDGIGLGRASGGIFDSMVVGPSAQELIKQSHLVRSHVIGPPPITAPEKMIAGEFDQGAVSAVCDTNEIIGDTIKHWKKYANGWKTVAFCADQKHGTHVADRFNEAGIEATTVFDFTPDHERKKIWNDFDNGSLKVICTCSIISYGWDHSICKVIIDLAHTTSLSGAIQRWARGSRPHKGYDHFRVIDQVGNCDRKSKLAPNGFGFYEDDREWSLDGKAVRLAEEGDDTSPGIVSCPQCYHRFRYGKKECPACGFTIPIQHRVIKVVDGELVERQRAEQKTMAINAWRTRLTEDEKRAKYEEWVETGKKRNYSPKWAMMTAKRVFGFWPKREWSHPADGGIEKEAF